jgi:phytoene desaturase
MSVSRRIIVIGAGVGGLAAAARLAAKGHQVSVFEQSDVVGGKLGLFERDGFRFDTGPSIVTLPEVYRNLWKSFGASFDEDITLRPLDPIARYRFGDGAWFDASSEDSQFYANAEALRRGNAEDLKRFFARAEAIWQATKGPFLERPLGGWKGLARQSKNVGDLRLIAPWKSLRTLNNDYVNDPRMVSFLDRYATYTGSDPRRAPAALASIAFVERHYGGWYIEGGLYRLAEKLAAHVVRLGGELHVNSPVAAIRLHGNAVGGVTLADGSNHDADMVVANADARHLYNDLLPSDAKPVTRMRAKLRRTTPSLSGFVLCLAVEGRTENQAHHTVLFPENYDAEFDDLFGPRPQPIRDPTIYCSVPDDPTIAPDGSEAWFVLVNAPCHRPGSPGEGVDWETPGLADRYADQVLRLMAERGVDIRDRVLFREIRTPAHLGQRTRSVGGAIYGTSSNGALAAFLRPENASPIPGLYLVGGSSHPGGGLPLVTLSAQIVCELIDRL